MKILYLADNYYPEITPGAFRPTEHSRIWVEKGEEVTVITGIPNFPRGKPYAGYEDKKNIVENIQGVTVDRVSTYMTPNEGFLRRSLDFLSFTLSAIIRARKYKCDIILTSSPPLFTGIAAFVVSKIKKKPWIFEIRDLWPESIRDVGLLGGGFLYRLLEKCELFLYRKAHAIVCLSPAFRDDLINRGIDENRIHVIPNGAPPRHQQKKPLPDSHKQILVDLRKKYSCLFGYVGRLGMAHRLEQVLYAARKCAGNDIHFVFIGEGAEKGKLLKLRSTLKVNNVTFLEPLSREQVFSAYDYFDAGLVVQRKGETFKKNIPSKLFDLAAAGLPILLGVEGEAQKLVQSRNCGICFEPENADELAQTAVTFCGDTDLQKNLSKNSLRLAAEFDRDKMAEKMLRLLQQTAGEPKDD